MNKNIVMSGSELPNWFEYPPEFLRIIEQGLLDFDPWVILQGQRLKNRYEGIRERYPERKLIPFAKREDNDDVACWEKKKPGRIVIIHDFSSPGYEDRQELDCFWSWLREALEATINFDP